MQQLLPMSVLELQERRVRGVLLLLWKMSCLTLLAREGIQLWCSMSHYFDLLARHQGSAWRTWLLALAVLLEECSLLAEVLMAMSADIVGRSMNAMFFHYVYSQALGE